LALDPLYLATAVEAALVAARIQKRFFRQNPDIRKKGRIDLVTAADLEVERTFRALVADRFPSHAVLGEEATLDHRSTGRHDELRPWTRVLLCLNRARGPGHHRAWRRLRSDR
jgi:fructose-1,6-bisphosphatase/inositol monophosphatase family enzyme